LAWRTSAPSGARVARDLQLTVWDYLSEGGIDVPWYYGHAFWVADGYRRAKIQLDPRFCAPGLRILIPDPSETMACECNRPSPCVDCKSTYAREVWFNEDELIVKAASVCPACLRNWQEDMGRETLFWGPAERFRPRPERGQNPDRQARQDRIAGRLARRDAQAPGQEAAIECGLPEGLTGGSGLDDVLADLALLCRKPRAGS
jgi:hypothetical protein